MSKITVSAACKGLRAYLQQSVLFTDAKKPNGLLSYDRLNNAVTEDVIIEPLAMIYPGALQTGVINVNVWVINLALEFKGTGVDKSQRNQARIEYLETLLLKALTPPEDSNDDAIYFDGYSYTYQQARVYQDTADQHYINVRVEFNAITV